MKTRTISGFHTSSSALLQTPAASEGQERRPSAFFVFAGRGSGSRADEPGSRQHQSRRARTADRSAPPLPSPPQRRPWGAKMASGGQESLTSADRAAPTLRYFSLRRLKQTTESRFIPPERHRRLSTLAAPPHLNPNQEERNNKSNTTEERQQLLNSSMACCTHKAWTTLWFVILLLRFIFLFFSFNASSLLQPRERTYAMHQ